MSEDPVARRPVPVCRRCGLAARQRGNQWCSECISAERAEQQAHLQRLWPDVPARPPAAPVPAPDHLDADLQAIVDQVLALQRARQAQPAAQGGGQAAPA